MKRMIYKNLHNLFSSLGMESQRMWCYLKWMKCYVEKDSILGYFAFADDFFKNGYHKRVG